MSITLAENLGQELGILPLKRLLFIICVWVTALGQWEYGDMNRSKVLVFLCYFGAFLIFAPTVAAQPDPSAVVERVKPAVVLIITLDRWGDLNSLGSGFLISPEGWILTNAHVLQGAAAVGVRFGDGSIYIAQLVKFDYANDFDIALLKIEGHNFPFLVLGDSDAVKVLDYVIVIGYPRLDISAELGTGIDVTVTDGKVSRVHKRRDGFEAIQITAPINSGNSGGPVVDSEGKVIGIATWAGRASQNIQGFNFAISINVAKRRLLTGIRLPNLPTPQPETIPPPLPTPTRPPQLRSDWPSAHIKYWPLVATVGTPVTFDASDSSSMDSLIVSYTWDFDADGRIDATGLRASHIFPKPGFYSVTLTVTNAKGLRASRTVTLLVRAQPDTSLPSQYSEFDREIIIWGYKPEDPLSPNLYGLAIQSSNRFAAARLLLELHILDISQGISAASLGLEIFGKINLLITKLYLGIGAGIPYIRALAGLEFDLWALRLYSEVNYTLALNAIPNYQVKVGIGWIF